MKLYRLENVPWADSQLLYHTFPRIGQEGLNLPIPVFRREVDGGAVYLERRQEEDK